MEILTEKRKSGPRGGKPNKIEPVSIGIDPDLREWAKNQDPDGLSALVRRLLRQERARVEKAQRANRREP